MTRRGGKGPDLTVRVSHEANRLGPTHVAAAFEWLVPVLERQTRLLCAEGVKHETEAARGGAKPVTDPLATRDVTSCQWPLSLGRMWALKSPRFVSD